MLSRKDWIWNCSQADTYVNLSMLEPCWFCGMPFKLSWRVSTRAQSLEDTLYTSVFATHVHLCWPVNVYALLLIPCSYKFWQIYLSSCRSVVAVALACYCPVLCCWRSAYSVSVFLLVYFADVGLYRDNGLAVIKFKHTNSLQMERISKSLYRCFKEEGLRIIVEMNMSQVNFLDVTLKMIDGTYTYRQHRKPNRLPAI